MADAIPTVSAGGQTAQPTTGTQVIRVGKKRAAKKPVKHRGPSLAAQLADPGMRSKLPDSALTPDLLAKRQQNQFNAAPAAPGSSYTNQSLNQLLSVLERQKFGPQLAALSQREQMVPAWFAEYRSKVAASQAAAQARDAALASSLGQMAGQAGQDTGGFANDPVAQAAAAVRGAGVGNQAALAQQLGGIQSSYLGNLGLNSYGLQTGAQQQLGRDRQDLAQQQGDFRVTERQNILSDEASNALKAALTEAQTGSAKAATASTKAKTQKTQADVEFFKQHGYYPKTGPTAKKSPDVITSGPFAGYTKQDVAKMGPAQKQQLKADYSKSKAKGTKADQPVSGPGSLTSSAEAKIVSQVNKVLDALMNPTTTTKDINGNPTVKASTPQQVLKDLRAQHVDPRVLNVARSLFHNKGKGIGQFGVKNAHDLGIHVAPHWKVIR